MRRPVTFAAPSKVAHDEGLPTEPPQQGNRCQQKKIQECQKDPDHEAIHDLGQLQPALIAETGPWGIEPEGKSQKQPGREHQYAGTTTVPEQQSADQTSQYRQANTKLAEFLAVNLLIS